MFFQLSSSLCCNPDVNCTSETDECKLYSTDSCAQRPWVLQRCCDIPRLIAAQRDSQTAPLALSHPKPAEGFPQHWLLQPRILTMEIIPLPLRAAIQVPVLLSPQFCICSNLQKLFEVTAFGLACQYATSGDFTRKCNLLTLDSGKRCTSQRLWDGAGSEGCQIGTSTREKVSIFVTLVPNGNRYCLGQSQACLRLAPCKVPTC